MTLYDSTKNTTWIRLEFNTDVYGLAILSRLGKDTNETNSSWIYGIYRFSSSTRILTVPYNRSCTTTSTTTSRLKSVQKYSACYINCNFRAFSQRFMVGFSRGAVRTFKAKGRQVSQSKTGFFINSICTFFLAFIAKLWQKLWIFVNLKQI